MVLAAAEHSAVPIVVDRSTEAVVGNGDIATPPMAVSTTRAVNLDLASWEYTLSRRRGVRVSARRQLMGMAAAVEGSSCVATWATRRDDDGVSVGGGGREGGRPGVHVALWKK